MYCHQCGKNIEPDERFCAFCGAAVRETVCQAIAEDTRQEPEKQEPPKETWRAVVAITIAALIVVFASLIYIDYHYGQKWEAFMQEPSIREVQSFLNGGTGFQGQTEKLKTLFDAYVKTIREYRINALPLEDLLHSRDYDHELQKLEEEISKAQASVRNADALAQDIIAYSKQVMSRFKELEQGEPLVLGDTLAEFEGFSARIEDIWGRAYAMTICFDCAYVWNTNELLMPLKEESFEGAILFAYTDKLRWLTDAFVDSLQTWIADGDDPNSSYVIESFNECHYDIMSILDDRQAVIFENMPGIVENTVYISALHLLEKMMGFDLSEYNYGHD